jgi:hypothetical protein
MAAQKARPAGDQDTFSRFYHKKVSENRSSFAKPLGMPQPLQLLAVKTRLPPNSQCIP